VAREVKKTVENIEDTLPMPAGAGGFAVGAALPDFMQSEAGAGLENVDSGDMETPRLKLMQALSPEVEQHDNLKPGEFWHTMLERSIGRSFKAVAVYMDKRALLWRPQDDGGGILARSEDLIHWNPPQAEFKVKINKGTKEVVWRTNPLVAESGLLEWGSQDPDDPNSPPAATLMYNFLLTFPEMPDVPPAVLTLQRTSAKVARKLLGRMKVMRAPSYGIVLEIGSEGDSNSVGQKFQNVVIKPVGYVTDQRTFAAGKSLYESVRKTGINIREEQEADAMGTDPAGGGGGPIIDGDVSY